MKNTRRNFFLGTAAVVGLSVSAYATRLSLTPSSAERRLLRIPPLLDARKRGQSISLKVQSGQT